MATKGCEDRSSVYKSQGVQTSQLHETISHHQKQYSDSMHQESHLHTD